MKSKQAVTRDAIHEPHFANQPAPGLNVLFEDSTLGPLGRKSIFRCRVVSLMTQPRCYKVPTVLEYRIPREKLLPNRPARKNVRSPLRISSLQPRSRGHCLMHSSLWFDGHRPATQAGLDHIRTVPPEMSCLSVLPRSPCLNRQNFSRSSRAVSCWYGAARTAHGRCPVASAKKRKKPPSAAYVESYRRNYRHCELPAQPYGESSNGNIH
jgi:hypothetical protein